MSTVTAQPTSLISPPFAAILLLSAAALSYEILLIRLFSIIQWHHFAYMMISVALLGYGASGSFVALARRPLQAKLGIGFVSLAALFGLTTLLSFVVAQRISFNPLEILWDPTQFPRLLAVYLTLFVPFFCAATCLCLSYASFPNATHRIYSMDILGASAGCIGIIAALFLVPPEMALRLIASVAFASAAVAAWQLRVSAAWLAAFIALMVIGLILTLPQDWTELRPSPYKELSQALQVKEAHIVAELSSPLGAITVVESPLIAFRHAPGLSLNAPMEPPPQLGIFTDGDSLSALTRFDGNLKSLAYLDYLSSALPYHLVISPQALVLGAGAGGDVLQAYYHRASAIDAVELNPQIVDLVKNRYASFSGGLYDLAGVTIHIAEARGFVAKSRDYYDVIQLSPWDAFGSASAGLNSLAESYIYTVEAFQQYLARLRPNGLLSVTRWSNLPPREVLKVFATAVAALERNGLQARSRLVLIRGWKTATLLIKNGEFSAPDIAAIKTFCRDRSFDVEYYPGIAPTESNRYNIIDQPYFFEGAQALLGKTREEFMARYKFNIMAATDDRPFYFQFFKWQTLPEILRLKEQGGLPLLEWGYPILVASLVQAVMLSLMLVILPLAFWRLPYRERTTSSRRRLLAYFLAIGFAFMFIEIAFIQKLILFLHHPVYAIALVLASFLLFAGLGSGWSERLSVRDHAPRARTMIWPIAILCVLVIAYLYLLPEVSARWIALPEMPKITLAVALIAPLAFCMGMPFPMGLARVNASAPELVPWAWGINACASVIAAILASVLAIHYGFNAVTVLAVVLYIFALISFPQSTEANPFV
jgi:hypothetical protein